MKEISRRRSWLLFGAKLVVFFLGVSLRNTLRDWVALLHWYFPCLYGGPLILLTLYYHLHFDLMHSNELFLFCLDSFVVSRLKPAITSWKCKMWITELLFKSLISFLSNWVSLLRYGFKWWIQIVWVWWTFNSLVFTLMVFHWA